MIKKYLSLAFALSFFQLTYAQVTGVVTGTVKNKNTQESLQSVSITFEGNDTFNITTDTSGFFKTEMPVGKYNLKATYTGFSTVYIYNVNVSSGNAQVLQLEMEEAPKTLDEIVINPFRSVRATDMVTPISTQKLTSEEIKVNPGGNFDVSKVIQVLPGVSGGTTPNRNDIIVRGGGPSENVYYLDGIEIPVLNHFQTQGASGGATGILNVSFIQDVQLTSSAFDSRYDNALSSTIVIKQRNGDPNTLSGNIRLSGSEFATTLEGPLGKKTTFLASARRSYLQFLFKLLDLPIRPDYYDFQYKINHKFNKKSELSFIGIGAIDIFKLAVPDNADAENEYIIRANPLIKQWNYTVGANFKRLVNNGYYTVTLSRNMFFNGADRFENNALQNGNKLYSLGSHEIENKLRFSMNKFNEGWKYSYGIDAQYVKYDADIFKTIRQEIKDNEGNMLEPAINISNSTDIDFFKYGLYAQAARYFFNDKLLISGGTRADINSYLSTGANLFKTFSPRISFSYALNDEWNISASAGSYYKLPPYTMLGFKNINGQLANKDLKYINAVHFTAGTQFIPRNDWRFTIEGFYKIYRDYPVSATTGISFANIGTDYAAVGNDIYVSNGKGRVYGIETYMQQKLIRRLFYVVSATIFKSEFSGADGVYKPSTWDYGYVVSSTMGYKFNRNWEAGIKYRIAGGQPYTPFDLQLSRAEYLTLGTGVYDYSKLNQEKLPLFQQLDLRVDKKINFRKVSLDIFLDLQNVFLYKTAYLPKYTFERNDDNTGFKTTDGEPVRLDGSNSIPIILKDRSATVVPALGFIFEF